MKVDIIGSKYDSPLMDFERMIEVKPRTLFIFNDNWVEHYTTKRGSGNANIRPYNHVSGMSIPRSFGIPTGNYRKGYVNLAEGKQSIDTALSELRELIQTGNYDRIVYSIDNYGSTILGRGIFVIGEDVKRYITGKILELGIGRNYYYISYHRGTEGPYEIKDVSSYFN